MTTIDDASEVSLKAMISSNKVKLENLTFLKHSHNIDDLINKKTDVISAYISKSPYTLQKKVLNIISLTQKNMILICIVICYIQIKILLIMI